MPTGDLTAWGLACTAVSNSTFKDIHAINCWNGGVGIFILSNYNKGNFHIENCGFSPVYGNEPGFDVNSSSYNNFNVIVKDCAYGARILDNCFNNDLKATIINATYTGFLIGNQLINIGSSKNTVHATIQKGCKDQAVSIAGKVSNNIFIFNINDVQGLGVHELDSSYINHEPLLVAKNNNYVVSSQHCGRGSVSIGGMNGTWDINSFADGRSGAPGDFFAMRVVGKQNLIKSVIKDSSKSKVGGIVFLKNAMNNKVVTYKHKNLITVYEDNGINNYKVKAVTL